MIPEIWGIMALIAFLIFGFLGFILGMGIVLSNFIGKIEKCYANRK